MDIFNGAEFEAVPLPVPANATPREFLLRMTGYDFDNLETCTWEDVRKHPFIQSWMTTVLARCSKPQVVLIKKQ